MARSVAWRRTCNDLVNWRQTESLNATIYILRETGPTGFLLKEEGEQKPYKVYLGDPHTCTCPQFKKDRDLCKHICWLILKKFRVPQDNPITWQLGLVEREINEILFGVASAQKQKPKPKWKKQLDQEGNGKQTLQQRDIGKDDVCPICQDELLSKHLPVTFCKFGCGNSIHIKCMKIWADHQTSSGDKTIKCPFCREDFGPIELLKQESRNASGPIQGGRMDRHLGTECQSCHVSPIEGKCYRCTTCSVFYLCQTCFNTPTHTHHGFEYRHKRNQRWKAAARMYGLVLPQAVAESLHNRELSETDYDLLMQLDNNTSTQKSDIPESVVESFPLERIRERSPLLAPGMQCRVCLRGYAVGQFIRKLPRCKHKFHKDCIDNWLIHSHPTCPVDGQIVWDPHAAEEETEDRRQRPLNQEQGAATGSLGLEIPGVGIATRGLEINNTRISTSTRGQTGRRVPQNRQQKPVVTQEDSLRSSFTLNGLGLGGSSDGETTAITDLPGNRLLGRAQAKRASLNQKLSINGNSASRGCGLNVNGQGSRRRTEPQPVEPEEEEVSYEVENSVGTRDEALMTPTQRVILNHLAMLQTPDEEVPGADAVRSVQNATPQRVLRNTYSSSDLRSPFVRDLPPLIESDLENGYTTDGETDTMSLHSSMSYPYHRLQTRLSDRGSVRSVRSTPASVITPQQLDVHFEGISGSVNVRLAGRDRSRRSEHGTERNLSGAPTGSRDNQPEARILNRLQEITDLYLQGNGTENNVSTETGFISHPGLPPRPSRRHQGKLLGSRTREKKREVNLGLDGNTLGNMTIGDLL